MTNPHRDQPVVARGAPLAESHGAVLMLHGRGRNAEDVLSLAYRIGDRGLAYLAPEAGGGSWYPYSFLEPLDNNEPNLSQALEAVDVLVEDLVKRGFGRERIFFAGFSQGACLAAAYAARHATRYGGLLIFTGGLIGPPEAEWSYEGSFEGTPVFMGTSDVDEFVPEERVRETAEVLENLGADVRLRVYPDMEHLVNDDEIAAARELLRMARSSKSRNS